MENILPSLRLGKVTIGHNPLSIHENVTGVVKCLDKTLTALFFTFLYVSVKYRNLVFVVVSLYFIAFANTSSGKAQINQIS